MTAGLTFPRDERLDMGRVFDLLAFVVTARMAGDDLPGRRRYAARSGSASTVRVRRT